MVFPCAVVLKWRYLTGSKLKIRLSPTLVGEEA